MCALLTRYNAAQENLFTKLGRKQAAKLTLLQQDRWVLGDRWEDFDQSTQRLEKVDARLSEFAATAPVAEAEARAVLASMPGVGAVTIETILAERGDWRRFRNADAVVSFAGLDPGVRESDGRRKDLRLVGSLESHQPRSRCCHRLHRLSVAKLTARVQGQRPTSGSDEGPSSPTLQNKEKHPKHLTISFP